MGEEMYVHDHIYKCTYMDKPVILQQMGFWPPEDTWKCLEIFLIVTTEWMLPASSE